MTLTMAFDEKYVPAMIVGKLIAGVLAIVVANYIYEVKYHKTVCNVKKIFLDFFVRAQYTKGIK